MVHSVVFLSSQNIYYILLDLVLHVAVSNETGMIYQIVSLNLQALLSIRSIFSNVPLLIFENLSGATIKPLLNLYLLLCAQPIFSSLSPTVLLRSHWCDLLLPSEGWG